MPTEHIATPVPQAATSTALRIEEASVSARGVLLVRAAWQGPAAPAALELALDGHLLGTVPAGQAGRYEGWFVLEAAAAAGARQVSLRGGPGEATAAIAGRLGPTQGWFADRSWTASSDLAAALAPGAPGVLLVSDVLPRDGVARWLPVAQLAAALRQSGHRPLLLHFGALEDCQSDLATLLQQFDVVHHHATGAAPQGWDPASPGALPPVDRGLPQAVAAIAAAAGCGMAMAVSPAGLSVLGKLPPELPRGALLSRGFVLAPRMIFSPVPREKAAATLRGILAGTTLVLEDEGLRLELGKWLPATRAAVLPPLVALPAPPATTAGAAPLVLAVGATAARAVAGRLPPGTAVALLDDTTPLPVLADAVARATRVVLWTDAGVGGEVARHLAGLRGVPVVGQAPSPLPQDGGGEAAVAALEALLTEGAELPPAPLPAWTAAGFAAELGLPPADAAAPADGGGLLARLLAMRLHGQPDPRRVGLLVEPQRPDAMLLAAAFARVAGPGRVFALNPPPGAALLPLGTALQAGVDSVLLDLGEDAAAGRAAMQRVLDCGLLPVPLVPRAGWTDAAGLARLRGMAAGKVAYVGPGPVPPGAALVLATGGAALPGADAVELQGPADPRRGRLATIFAANDDAFWRRPPAPALGYDRDPAAPGLAITQSLAVPHEAVPMLALALLLGCSRVLLPAAWRRLPALAAALAALGQAGIAVDAAPDVLLEMRA